MNSCTIKSLPEDLQIEAAARAIDVNPINRPEIRGLAALGGPDHLAVLTTRYWGVGGVDLTVGFLEDTSQELATRILSHMNAWSQYCNVKFRLGGRDSQVRITRNGDGYWSYLGTDILSIPKNQPTMCLQGFNLNTPENEFRRVVRHETGHTLSMPHEHMRRQIVEQIDVNKAIAYFRQTQGWDAQTTRQQVLTPLDERSLMGTTNADPTSIMAYQLPGQIMRNGQPVPGGRDITQADGAFAAKVYPLPTAPEPPVPPTPPEPPTPGTYVVKIKSLVIDVNGSEFATSSNGPIKPAPKQERSPMTPEHQLEALHAEAEALMGQAQAAISAGKFCEAYPTLKSGLQKALETAKSLALVPFIGKYASVTGSWITLGISGLDLAALQLGCGIGSGDLS